MITGFNPCFYGFLISTRRENGKEDELVSFNPCFYGFLISTRLALLLPIDDIMLRFQSLFLWIPNLNIFLILPISSVCLICFNPCFYGFLISTNYITYFFCGYHWFQSLFLWIPNLN